MKCTPHLFFVWILALSTCQPRSLVAQEEPNGKMTVRALQVADRTVEVVTHMTTDEPRWLLCNLHDDENTSVEAALQVYEAQAGRLVELRHSGEREIVFSIDGQEYRCDPNRIFTSAGVEATLEKLSRYDERAGKQVRQLGQSLTEHYQIDSVAAVIALHNNSEARYAATSYAKGQEYEKEAAAVHLVPNSDPDDFFFVTDERLFGALKDQNANVVLQDNAEATDDGSLSVYCGQRGILYVNVEAQHGHLEQQIAMLETLFEVLAALQPDNTHE